MDCDNDYMCERESKHNDMKRRKKQQIFTQSFKHFSISFSYACSQLHKLILYDKICCPFLIQIAP